MWRKSCWCLGIILVLILFSDVVDSCDWQVEILSDNIFNDTDNFEFRYKITKIEGEKTKVTLVRAIEDVYGSIIKDYNNYTKEISTQHTIPYLSPTLDFGTYLIKGEIFPDCNDTNLENNYKEKLIVIFEPENVGILNYTKIKINEFLPDPVGEDDSTIPNGEWIELYNMGEVAVDIQGLGLKDNYGQEIDIFVSDTNTINNTIINAYDYLVVYTNEHYGFLTNEGFEEINLSYGGTLIDSVSYSGSSEGVSYSKINGIWKMTPPTPGFINVEDTVDTNESILKIEKIYLGSDEKANFGESLRVKISVYKGDTEKYSVQLWIEDERGNEISKKTRFNVNDKFVEHILTLPIQIYANCNEKYSAGEYIMVLEGLDDKDKEKLKIQGLTLSLCEKLYIKTPSKKSSESDSEDMLLLNSIKEEQTVNKEDSSVEEITGMVVFESSNVKAQKLILWLFAIASTGIVIQLYFREFKK